MRRLTELDVLRGILLLMMVVNLCEKERALPLPKPLPPILIFLALAFFAWRLLTILAIPLPPNQAWLLDKWHLGALRLLNFLATGWALSKVLGHLQRWETLLHPFSLIGRNMLPVFSSQIGLSMLLIGIIPSPGSVEPFSSVLVICQLITAFLLALFFEWTKQKKKSLVERVGAGGNVSASRRRGVSACRAPVRTEPHLPTEFNHRQGVVKRLTER